MVGGIVIEVTCPKSRPEVVYVNCADRHRPKDQCAILVERNETSLQIEIGDSLWWQGGYVMWTPQANRAGHLRDLKCGTDYDIQIPRVGYSGVNRPD